MSNNEFYAAFIESSYRVEGDERSKQCPGHGYPAHTVDYTEVRQFKDEEEMQGWVYKQEKSAWRRNKYRIVKCIPMNVSKTIEIKVG